MQARNLPGHVNRHAHLASRPIDTRAVNGEAAIGRGAVRRHGRGLSAERVPELLAAVKALRALDLAKRSCHGRRLSAGFVGPADRQGGFL